MNISLTTSKFNSQMSLVPIGLLSGLTSLTSLITGLHMPPCLIIGGKVYGGITVIAFIAMVLTKEKSTSNRITDQLQECGAILCLSLRCLMMMKVLNGGRMKRIGRSERNRYN